MDAAARGACAASWRVVFSSGGLIQACAVIVNDFETPRSCI